MINIPTHSIIKSLKIVNLLQGRMGEKYFYLKTPFEKK